MKKLFLMIVSVLMTMAAAFADDAAALRRLVLQDNEFIAEGKYAETIKHYAKDFCSIDQKSQKTTYNDIKMIVLMMDGKHPEDFLTFMFKTQAKREPTAEEVAKIKELVNNEQFKVVYLTAINKMKDAMSKSAKISLETLRFIKVSVDGNQAVVTWEYEEIDPADMTFNTKRKKSSTGKFRKENGAWKFVEIKSTLISDKK